MTDLKTKEPHQQMPFQHSYMVQDQDISLIDLWISIRRYKKRFMFVFVMVFVVCLLLAYYILPEKYYLVSTIQIGSREKDNAILPIESPESLLSKINSSIIPSYTNKWNRQHDFMGLIETESSNPKNSDIILITNKTNQENIEFLSDFQKELVEIIIHDHRRMINSLKSKVESELRLAQVKLDHLKNPLTLEFKQKAAQIELDDEIIKLKKLEDERFFGLEKEESKAQILQAKHEKELLDDLEKVRLKQYERIDENKRILREKIDDLKLQISTARKNLRNAAALATEQSAMSQLMIANEFQQNQNQLAAFEERYHIGLENERTELMHEIEAIRLQKIESLKKIDLLNDKYKVLLEENSILRDRQKLKVDEAKVKLEEINLQHKISTAMLEEKMREIKTRLDNFSETRAVTTAVQSLKPIGSSRLQLIFLSFIAACVIGFVAVFFAIFGDKVKARLEEDVAA